jgi:hypothetical protein
LYDDDEWEFINIDHEPVLFLNDSSEHNSKAHSTSKSKGSNNNDDKAKNENKVDDVKRKSSRIR